MKRFRPLRHVHFVCHKPFGCLSQFISNAKHQRNKKFLGVLYNFPEGVMPIGRLDQNSEGLLLLTTDGALSNTICKSPIEKEYYVQVDGDITEMAINQLQKGVTIGFEGIIYETLPCKVYKLEQSPDFPERSKKIRDARHGPTSWISVTITEGKFRQVRKMTAAVGFSTLRLVRIRIGHIYLNKMQPGEVIKLSELNIV